MAEADPIESSVRAGAVAALRRRAARQVKIAADGTTNGERGAIIRSGEAVLAVDLAVIFSQLADEIEREAGR